eukprot:scaffold159125_cov49-Prasinocladus_malaysianus.AAC.1
MTVFVSIPLICKYILSSKSMGDGSFSTYIRDFGLASGADEALSEFGVRGDGFDRLSGSAS